MSFVTLNLKTDNKLTIVTLGKIILYFSYQTLVALVYCFNKRKKLFLNKCRIDYLAMTLKDSNKLNSNLNTIILSTKLHPIKKTEDQFDQILREIITL